MNRISILILSIFIGGCATSKNDFEGTNDFSKPIANGLYYLREGAAGRIFESADSVKNNWQMKANNLCAGSEFEALIYQDSEQHLMVTDPEFFFLPFWAQGPAAVAEGVVHCGSSTLSREQAIQVLIDEYYILRKQP